MSEVVTACLTAFVGVVILVAGQLTVKFFIEPLHEHRRLIGRIADSLVAFEYLAASDPILYDSPVVERLRMAEGRGELLEKLFRERTEATVRNTWKAIDEITHALRQQASQLMATTYAVPLYSFWVTTFGRAPKHEDIVRASRLLKELSFSTAGMATDKRRIAEIASLLCIEVLRKNGAS